MSEQPKRFTIRKYARGHSLFFELRGMSGDTDFVLSKDEVEQLSIAISEVMDYADCQCECMYCEFCEGVA